MENLIYMSKKKILFCFLGAFCGIIGVVRFLGIGINERNFTNNIIYALLFVVIFYCYWKMLCFLNIRTTLYSCGFSLFLSTILVVGAQIEYNKELAWTFNTTFDILLLTFFGIPVIDLILYYFKEKTVFSFKSKIRWSKIKIFLIITSVWMLAYIALYPGIYDYDSINQTLQFLVTHQISGHHPVIHSFILSAFLKLGDIIAGSYQIGLGIYSLAQLLLLSYTAMQVCWFLFIRKHTILFYLSLIFFSAFPLHYIMAVWATKDIFFTVCFVLISLEILKFLENKSEYFKSKVNIIRYATLVILMCMFRNNGVYAIIIMLPINILCLRKKSAKIVLITVISLSVYFLYQNVLLTALGVVPGNMREMLSIPCQQLAKVYVERPECFSEEEKTLLFNLIPENNLKDYEYRPQISDVTKNHFNTEEFKSDSVKYTKLYIKIGLRSPRKYIEAFLENSLGFWYPNKSYPDSRMFHPYTEFKMADPNLFKGDYIYIERNSLFPAYEELLEDIILDTEWTNYPVSSNLYVPGTYFIILCFTAMLCCYMKRWDKFVILSLWAAFWLTLLISPVALVRYAYPVIFCLPLCGYIIFSRKNNKN